MQIQSQPIVQPRLTKREYCPHDTTTQSSTVASTTGQ